MTGTLRQFGWTGLLLAGLLLVGPDAGEASHEAFAVYEDGTTSRTIRSDRWTAVEGGLAQERRHSARPASRRASTLSICFSGVSFRFQENL